MYRCSCSQVILCVHLHERPPVSARQREGLATAAHVQGVLSKLCLAWCLVCICVFRCDSCLAVKLVKSTNEKVARKSIVLRHIPRLQAAPGLGSCGQARKCPGFRAAFRCSGHLLHPFRCLNVIWVHQA